MTVSKPIPQQDTERTPTPTVGQSTVVALSTYLMANGISRAKLTERFGNTLLLTDDQEARIPLEHYVQLWDAAIRWTGDAALGLKLGVQHDVSEMGIVAHVVLNCENLRSGLEQYVRLFSVVNDAISLSLDDDRHGKAQYASLNFMHRHPELYCIPDVERTLVLAFYRTRAWLGKELRLKSVSVQHQAPSYLTRYRQVFGCPVYFNQSDCKIVFEQQYFDLRPKRSSPYLKTAALQYANSLLDIFSRQPLSERVKTLIYRDIEQHEPDIVSIAARLNMSQQTLYRKLKHEGVFFQKLVESVRFTKARQLLAQSGLSASEIALMLGFSELSAFSRAFKRWSGMSPKAFRDGIPAS